MIDPLSTSQRTLGFFAILAEDGRVAGYSKNSPIYFIAHLLSSPGLLAVFLYRLASYFHKRAGFIGKALAKLFTRINELMNSCEINIHAKIGHGLYLPHPYSIVIGKGSQIGNYCTIYQNVTLGMRHARGGDIEDGYPTLTDHVIVSAGAVLCGPITVGENAVIGANAVVLRDVPANAVAVGVPARILGS